MLRWLMKLVLTGIVDMIFGKPAAKLAKVFTRLFLGRKS